MPPFSIKAFNSKTSGLPDGAQTYDGQHALSIGFIQGRRVDLDRFTAFAGKIRSFTGLDSPRSIEDEIGVEAWFLSLFQST